MEIFTSEAFTEVYKMIYQIRDFIKSQRLNIYDLALMDEGGVRWVQTRPSSGCHDAYSITKLFLVTAVGRLHDRGLISLNDRMTALISPYLDFPYDPVWDQVTVAHALTHTMGIQEGVIDIDRDDTSLYPTDNYLEYIFSAPPVHKPGTYRKYTDVPHYLLSLAVEAITGERAEDGIKKELLEPLGFSYTAWTSCPRNHTIGSSGLYLTAKDMVKLPWLYLNRGIFEGTRLVSQSWVEQVMVREFDLYPLDKSGWWGKGGLNGQMVMFNPEHHLALAWLGCEPDPPEETLLPWLNRILS